MADAQTSDAGTPLVEVRLFKLHPGTREEWHRISHEHTIPLMRECGITVLAYGPSLNEEDAYYLVRLFPSEEERTVLGQSLYTHPEWDQYEEPVSGMMAAYHTIVMPATSAVVEAMSTR